jgi:antitoxin component YwqK of YwqJK toxin-antitoxin module
MKKTIIVFCVVLLGYLGASSVLSHDENPTDTSVSITEYKPSKLQKRPTQPQIQTPEIVEDVEEIIPVTAISPTDEEEALAVAEEKPKNGVIKEYHWDGILKSELSYVDGELNGVSKQFYEDGKLKSTMSYENGLKSGLETTYSKNNNDVIGLIKYENGEKEGLAKAFYGNNKLKQTTTYKNGNAHGKSQVYYKNGKIAKETGYLNGQRNGVTRWYHDNGKIKRSAKYVNGKMNKKSVQNFSKDGRVLRNAK